METRQRVRDLAGEAITGEIELVQELAVGQIGGNLAGERVGRDIEGNEIRQP